MVHLNGTCIEAQLSTEYDTQSVEAVIGSALRLGVLIDNDRSSIGGAYR